MAQFEKLLYTDKAHTTGGREGGQSRAEDGRLEVAISPPGGKGTGTNLEQLFTAGRSTCFLSAIKVVAGKKKVAISGVAVDAEVDLGMEHGNYGLAARLKASIPGVDREMAQALVDAAHELCPYSRATRGNIEVTVGVA